MSPCSPEPTPNHFPVTERLSHSRPWPWRGSSRDVQMHSGERVRSRTEALVCCDRTVRPSRAGQVGTGLKAPGHRLGEKAAGGTGREHSSPEGQGPRGTSPCSTPNRAASSTGRKTFILEETGVLSGVSQSQRHWSVLLVLFREQRGGGPGCPLGGGARATLLPFARWRGGGGCPLAATQPAHRGSSCSIPDLALARCTLLLAETPPPACGACCWGPREGAHERSQDRTERKAPAGGPGGGGTVPRNISWPASRTFHEPAPFLT